MKKLCVFLCAVLFSASLSATELMHLMRTPDASADKVCFIYQDDLFTANLDGTKPVRLRRQWARKRSRSFRRMENGSLFPVILTGMLMCM